LARRLGIYCALGYEQQQRKRWVRMFAGDEKWEKWNMFLRAGNLRVNAVKGLAMKTLAGFGLGLTALASQVAVAAPPNITGGPIPIAISNSPTSSTMVNLRDLGAITGSAPLIVTDAIFLVNGQTNGLIGAQLVPGQPGAVCVTISNIDFTPQPNDNYSLLLTITNLVGQTVGPVPVEITDTSGPTVIPKLAFLCNDSNSPPVADAGGSRTVPDSDGQDGESVLLDGSASSDADAGSVLTYQWFRGQATLGSPSTSPILNVTLPSGVNDISLLVTDDSGDTLTNSASTNIQITVVAPITLTADAGPDQAVNDTDGLTGESVTLNASGSSGNITGYQWSLGQQVLGTTAVLTTRLPDGVNTVTLIVSGSDGEGTITAADTVQVTVTAPGAPVANAGADRSVADSDQKPGESVTLDGSASTTPRGTISAYNWYLETGSESRDLLGSGVTLTAQLPDGSNNVTLEVTNTGQLTSSDSVVITVAAAPEKAVLSELPNLTPNQQRMAKALDSLCSQVMTAAPDPGESKPSVASGKKARAFASEEDQADLATKCQGLLINNTAANQVNALDELSGDDFSAARTQTLLFANFQYAGVLDRLMALRGGARGLSIAGLNIMVDGKMVPLATLQKMATDLLGGGASSDADEPGGLLSDKWGMWMRGNYSSGKKDASAASPSFDADQFALMGGLDYRLSDKAVLGGSLAYGNSSVEFNPSNEGALDTTSWALSLYGSMYAAKNFYFDAVLNIADSNYEADRNITYVDGQGLVNEDAHGDTDGMTVSGGLSGGYDFLVGGLTVSPNLGVFYIDATIDSFAEAGAGGLNLIYDEQNFKSLAANLGVRITYAWNQSWGVLLPHLRVDFVREFEDDVDVFGVRFAADPNAGSTPPILVETDNPDTSYWRLAGGLSAQFKYGFSGYVEYQRLQSFQFITFQDVSVGLRMQKSF
jgi:uncharacterized protein YhjY with autotransporter beta-barrel domain